MQILLCLPGNNFPSTGLFALPQFDKFVHVILFGGLVGLWCFFLRSKIADQDKCKRLFFLVFLLTAANGIGIEYIQYYFIPFRSFDNGDIIADLLASSIAYGICNVKLLTYQ